MLSRIKKNDLVEVVSGKDKGKQGRVLLLNPKRDLVMVQEIGLVTRHVKPRRQGEKGGIKKEEHFLHISKLMPVCPSCKKACRVQTKAVDGGEQKMRSCHRCKETF